MSHGAPARLALLALGLALGIPAASAEPAAGTTWTDPPARAPASAKTSTSTSAKTVAEPAKPAPASDAAATRGAALSPAPAAAPKVAKPAPRPARKAVAARRERAKPVARYVAPAPRRTRIVADSPVRVARPPRTAAIVPDAPAPRAAFQPYGYGPDEADARLDRLRAAEAAGYLVVRRRSVEFPDGRSLRIYRPAEEGEPF